MELNLKTWRIYAKIIYRAPMWDADGFPANKPLNNHNPTRVKIFSEDMEELVCEITAEDADDMLKKLDQLRRENPHVLEFFTDGPSGSMVEL